MIAKSGGEQVGDGRARRERHKSGEREPEDHAPKGWVHGYKCSCVEEERWTNDLMNECDQAGQVGRENGDVVSFETPFSSHHI